MSGVNHTQRAHALLAASKAARWLNCTPSAVLEDRYGEKSPSTFADEGTLAHELSELFLRRDILQNISDADFDDQLEELMNKELFDDSMLDNVDMYVEYCQQQYYAALTNCKYTEFCVEQKLDLSKYVPECFGTADALILSDATLEVIDFKYGKGVPVYADHNRQLMLYALGAYLERGFIYDIHTLRCSIVQPRLGNISSWEISLEELMDWADNTLKPLAAEAFAGRGELHSGDWCRFCAVKARCRRLYEEALTIASSDFCDANILSDVEIVEILKSGPRIQQWLDSVLEYAKNEAVEGAKDWPGFKLVEGRSIRKWANPEIVGEQLKIAFPALSDSDIYATSVRPLTAIERIVGKKAFAEKEKDLVIRPQGKLTLVPEADKRPAINITTSAVNDFQK